MIDTHCHLSYEDYDNLDDLIKEMDDNNIKCIVNGCDSKSNKDVLKLSKKYKNINAAIGFQPEYLDCIPNNYIKEIEDNIFNIVAIGEIGLDYHYTKDNIKLQKEVFERQLQLAEKYNIPVIVHTRDSINDTYEILKKYNVVGVIHAFNGSLEMANKFISIGFKLGIGGVITFKNCNLKDVIKNIDIKNIVFETDSPYLTPEPLRGTKNNPFNLKYIAEYLSKIKNIDIDKIYEIINDNTYELFDLK